MNDDSGDDKTGGYPLRICFSYALAPLWPRFGSASDPRWIKISSTSAPLWLRFRSASAPGSTSALLWLRIGSSLLSSMDWQRGLQGWGGSAGAAAMRPRGRVVAVCPPPAGHYGLAAGARKGELGGSGKNEASRPSCCRLAPPCWPIWIGSGGDEGGAQWQREQ